MLHSVQGGQGGVDRRVLERRRWPSRPTSSTGIDVAASRSAREHMVAVEGHGRILAPLSGEAWRARSGCLMSNEPTDDEIEAKLRAVPGERWDELWSAIEEVEDEGEHTTWGGGEQVMRVIDGVEAPVTTMPYAIYSEAVERLRGAIGHAGLVVPFGWMDWDGLQRYRSSRSMEGAPVADALRLVTAIVRSERFSDGSIGGALDSGLLLTALGRIRRWLREAG
jgi:hypothetical protein